MVYSSMKDSRCYAILFMLQTVVCPGLLCAADFWEPMDAVVDEVIIENWNLPPISENPQLNTDIPFNHFQHPFVNDFGDVSFIADGSTESIPTLNHGIYQSLHSGELITLVRAGEIYQTETGPESFKEFSKLQCHGQKMLFMATDFQQREGIYFLYQGSLHRIAKTGVMRSQRGLLLTEIRDASLYGDRVLFSAVDAGGTVSFLLYDIEQRSLKTIADSFIDSVTLNFSNEVKLTSQGAFFKTRQPINTDKPMEALVVFLWRLPAIEAGMQVDGLEVVIDNTVTIPFTSDEPFLSADALEADATHVVFRGRGTMIHGIYALNRVTKEIQVVVDSESGIPELFPDTFSEFGEMLALNHGVLTFTARSASGHEGVYRYDLESQILYLLLDNQSTVEDKSIESFELSTQPFLDNRFAVMIRFEEAVSGIYLATISDSNDSEAAELLGETDEMCDLDVSDIPSEENSSSPEIQELVLPQAIYP